MLSNYGRVLFRCGSVELCSLVSELVSSLYVDGTIGRRGHEKRDEVLQNVLEALGGNPALESKHADVTCTSIYTRVVNGCLEGDLGALEWIVLSRVQLNFVLSTSPVRAFRAHDGK